MKRTECEHRTANTTLGRGPADFANSVYAQTITARTNPSDPRPIVNCWRLLRYSAIPMAQVPPLQLQYKIGGVHQKGPWALIPVVLPPAQARRVSPMPASLSEPAAASLLVPAST